MRYVFTLMMVLAFGAQSNGREFPRQPEDQNTARKKHFDRVLIVVLENQSYVSAIKDPYLNQLAGEGVEFTRFRALGHPSYPNYLAMIAGSTFGVQGTFGDNQITFPDDARHRTIADFLTWKNYAENYPAKPGQPPYLSSSDGKYARKHVPFLSFRKIQQQSFANVVPVDPQDPENAFVRDVEASRKKAKDSGYKPLPAYMMYTPNLDNDGHDSSLGVASAWLKNFMEHSFPAAARNGTLIVITFDEAEGPEKASNHIYTVFLGDMVKRGQKVDRYYDHFDVLRTIEANFGIGEPLNAGDAKAAVIQDVWK